MRRAVIALLVFLTVSGCGAIMHGTKQDITVNSSPTGAKVMVAGEDRTAPAVFNLKRKNSYLVKINKEGYEGAEIMINHKLDWTAWADLFIWGIIPIFYDLSSGAAWKLSPEEISVNLNRSIGQADGPDSVGVRLVVSGDELSVQGGSSGITLSIEELQ